MGIQRTIQDYEEAHPQRTSQIKDSDSDCIESVNEAGSQMKKVSLCSHSIWLSCLEQQTLADYCQSCLAVNENTASFSVQSGSEQLMERLKEMWKALEILGLVDASLSNIAGKDRSRGVMHDAVISVEMLASGPVQSMLASSLSASRIEVSCRTERDAEVFSWTMEECEDVLEAVGCRLRAVGELFLFLSSSLFVQLHSLAEVVGEKLWPDLHQSLSAEVTLDTAGMRISECFPLQALEASAGLSENQKLSFLETTFREAVELEELLKTNGFISDSDDIA